MQREEKQLDMLLDIILTRLNDLKVSIGSMIQKLETEYETINWPTFLDNFALISSHLTGLSKIVSTEIPPPLRSLTVLPLMLSPEKDDALWHLTEGRIPVFSHDLVPDYLRTKPDPVVEARIAQYDTKANNLAAETALKNVTQYNKIVTHVFDMVSKGREELESESHQRTGITQTSSVADTNCILAAISNGKGIKHIMPGPLMPPRPAPGQPQINQSAIGRAPSSIKTNIKAANQIHPYNK